MERLFTRLQQEQILEVKVRLVALDSTVVKAHPDGTGTQKKGRSRSEQRLGTGFGNLSMIFSLSLKKTLKMALINLTDAATRASTS
jgi:hypothetical protein